MNNQILERAYRHCINNGYRFTLPRQHVLKILLDHAKPMGAYDILQKFPSTLGKQNPPTVYRAIKFWYQEGFIHCIDSLKAYIACCHGNHVGQSTFLICAQCEYVKEFDNCIDFSLVKNSADQISFQIKSYTVEVRGICKSCQ